MGKQKAYGTRLQYKVGGDWKSLKFAGDFTGPEITVETIDVTSHEPESVADDGYAEYISGLKDGGTVTVTVFFDPEDSEHDDLIDAVNSGAKYEFRVAPPGLGAADDEGCFTFFGYFTRFSLNAPVRGALTADIGIQVTGAVTKVAVTP